MSDQERLIPKDIKKVQDKLIEEQTKQAEALEDPQEGIS